MKKLIVQPPSPPQRPTRIKIPLAVSRHIPHDLPTKPKEHWRLASVHGAAVADVFIFCRPGAGGMVERTTAMHGWTLADVISFERFLMGCEPGFMS
jgi:hypothetical protein